MSRIQFSVMALCGVMIAAALAAALVTAIGKMSAFRFCLIHLLYAFTLLASSLATFGGPGIIPGVVILGFWTAVFTSRSRPRMLINALVALLVGFCLVGLMLPAFNSAREVARRMMCSNNLKQIMLAMHAYHDDFGSFPPAFVADKNGKPMHSWRVLLLPYLEQGALYRKYKFDEPWDGPNNRQLESALPHVYKCPSQTPTTTSSRRETNYAAVVGPATAWPGSRGRTLREFKDPVSDTVAIVEAAGSGVHWMEPRDLTVDQSVRLFCSGDAVESTGHRYEDFFYVHSVGRNVAMVDSSVKYVHLFVPSATWLALLRIDDGSVELEEGGIAWSKGPKRLKLGNCFRLSVFVLVALMPLPWVWLNPKSEIRSERH